MDPFRQSLCWMLTLFTSWTIIIAIPSRGKSPQLSTVTFCFGLWFTASCLPFTALTGRTRWVEAFLHCSMCWMVSTYYYYYKPWTWMYGWRELVRNGTLKTSLNSVALAAQTSNSGRALVDFNLVPDTCFILSLQRLGEHTGIVLVFILNIQKKH